MPDLNGLSPERRKAIGFGRRIDWIITVVILVIAVVFIYMLQSLPQRATFFPWFITISILSVGAVYITGKFRLPGRWDAQYDPATEVEHGEHDTGPAFLVPYGRNILHALGIFLGLTISATLVGPKFAVPIFVALALWMSGENKIAAVLSGIGFWLVVHFIFGRLMSINLPTGYLFELFG